MKKNVIVMLLAGLSSILIWPGCDSLFDDDDKDEYCEEHKLPDIKTREVFGYYVFTKSSQKEVNGAYSLYRSIEIHYTGVARNMDCSGTESEYQEFSYYVFPQENITIDSLSFELQVTPPIPFTFNNNRDYVSYSYKLRVVVEDGKIFESEEMYRNSTYYETFPSNHLFRTILPPYGDWHQVP